MTMDCTKCASKGCRTSSPCVDRSNETIVYCNGGIQSIYAVMFLAMKGYTKVKSLSGGFSRFMNN